MHHHQPLAELRKNIIAAALLLATVMVASIIIMAVLS